MANKSSGAFGLTPLTEDFSIDQPETTPDDADEKKKKSISRSKQWKEWVAFARQRQDLYKAYLPGVNPAMRHGSEANWHTADCIIREYELMISQIEG